jgi:hypothetical protein
MGRSRADTEGVEQPRASAAALPIPAMSCGIATFGAARTAMAYGEADAIMGKG